MHALPLLRTLLAALTCAMSVCPALADPAMPASDAATAVATRSAPSGDAELIEVTPVDAWLPGAIVAVYSTPVPHDTPSPGERNIVALLLVPGADNRDRSILIDVFGPEGANAQVIGVAFQAKKPDAAAVLRLEVQWLNNNGEIRQTCSYLTPSVTRLPARLERLTDTPCMHE